MFIFININIVSLLLKRETKELKVQSPAGIVFFFFFLIGISGKDSNVKR